MRSPLLLGSTYRSTPVGEGRALARQVDGLKGPFHLEGFGAGYAYTKGQLQLFVGDLTGQVRFAPLRGRFPKEIWT